MIAKANRQRVKGWKAVLKWMASLMLFASLHVFAQSSGTVTYVYTDPQGTPLAEADASGNITATFEYTPYGTFAPTGTSNPGPDPSGPGYTGHVNDPETNLVYMQARYYDPATGQFISIDSVSPAAANTFNFGRYNYGNNNPILNIDPDGRAGKIAYLVELTATGIRRLATITKEQAVIARRAGQNVLTERRQLSHEIEVAANGRDGLLKHSGHELDDGSTGLPHYQSEGVSGHTFWGELSVIFAATSDDLDSVKDYLDWIPDPTPRPATSDDMAHWEKIKSTAAAGYNYAYDMFKAMEPPRPERKQQLSQPAPNSTAPPKQTAGN
ncbi:RHS repeat-associated core domain-containing protein [Dyella caseinilytica]|uniref:RHS repeat-associated core domain-containing protein n=1 Tax=Dyella caseinilytica TaxID=1849581 RepID=A0ABX7GTH2_9GAMM|nr:RHS repeat-associated core domain-containing protein [Dyella caseinilytica]QRN53609.1 RHS repeat-associated core domain-containing protein [Dyella caseinilytica]GFZ87873.1 hypothetical protein GCM10011408_03120 [Dyella caseinilytica]